MNWRSELNRLASLVLPKGLEELPAGHYLQRTPDQDREEFGAPVACRTREFDRSEYPKSSERLEADQSSSLSSWVYPLRINEPSKCSRRILESKPQRVLRHGESLMEGERRQKRVKDSQSPERGYER